MAINVEEHTITRCNQITARHSIRKPALVPRGRTPHHHASLCNQVVAYLFQFACIPYLTFSRVRKCVQSMVL